MPARAAERQLLERIAQESAKRILRHSRGVRAIEDLRPVGYFEPGNAAHAALRAHAILESLGALEAEVAKDL